MQIAKTVRSLASLLPHPKTLMVLARKSLFVMRTPRKIGPHQILRSVLMAACEGNSHFRGIAQAFSSLAGEKVSRQAVFERLSHEAAPSFFASALREVLDGQARRLGALAGSRFASVLERARGVFGRLLIEDGSVVPLHRSLAEKLPGSVNQHGCAAALRLRWALDFLSGKTLDAELHPWRENDLSTCFDLLGLVREGDLLVRDMGYFCLEAFHEIARRGAWFLTRLPEGTVIGEPAGGDLDLVRILRAARRGGGATVDRVVRVGRATPVEGRLVAFKIDAPKAAQRRRKLRRTLRGRGLLPRQRDLDLCDWVVVFTNVGADRLDAESLAQLYRARWMVEIFFKGLKSGQGLEATSARRTNENTVQCLVYARMILGVISLNLWRIMTALVNPESARGDGERGAGRPGEMRTVGPLKVFESLPAPLLAAFRGGPGGRRFAEEIARLAHHATAEKRNRPSLDQLVFALLA